MRLFDKLFSSPRVAAQISDSPELATVLCVDQIVEHAIDEWRSAIKGQAGFGPDRFPFCRPPWDVSFVEANMPQDFTELPGLRQFGAFTISLREQHTIQHDEAGMHDLFMDITRAGAVELFCSTLAFNHMERVAMFPAQAVWGIDETGSLAGLKYAMHGMYNDLLKGDGLQGLILGGNLILESMLLSFTFANCSNVKLEDATADVAPSEKVRRRLKLPEVKRYTLNIAGHVARPSREYNEGPQGVMPFHLCRGHFATYTPEKPMFGNPKLVGRYWHPPHMRGKKENGEIIKDYAIQG